MYCNLEIQPGPSVSLSLNKYPVNIYPVKFKNRNTRKKCEICLKLTIKTLEQGQWRLSSVLIVNLEHISHLCLCFYCWLWTICWLLLRVNDRQKRTTSLHWIRNQWKNTCSKFSVASRRIWGKRFQLGVFVSFPQY